jgi:leucyl aminopeptidase
MPGAAAQRPGDVITQYGGTTVEVINTDAEGRLVLADAIAYAAAELEPTLIVDVATLTGAATVGLGRGHAALYSTDDALAVALADAGAAAGEPLWRMPLVDDYRRSLDSAIADVAHVETEKMGGGSITAALFLERFAGAVPWAHLDIAGPGRADADKVEVVKGGTAYGTRALLYWLESFNRTGDPGGAEGASAAP